MDAAQARETLQALRAASESCLTALDIPHQPRGKTRAWKDGTGPVGIGYHYTGGPNGISAAKWFNVRSRGNTGSSCHALVMGTQSEQLRELWERTEASALFHVPTLLLADLDRGTWHMNWANSRTFGVEIRNTGYHGYQRLDGGLLALGKTGKVIKDRTYEPYWREQVESAVVLGRMLRGIRGEKFSAEWVVGHSQIWATKQDPGPAFASMHEMREMIFSDTTLDQFNDILGRFDSAPDVFEEPEDDQEPEDDDRDDPIGRVEFWDADEVLADVPDDSQVPWVEQALRTLGWPAARDEPGNLKRYITWYQRSTLAWKKRGMNDRVLKVDGQAGPKTIANMRERLAQLRVD